MSVLKKIVLLTASVLLLCSCSSAQPERLKISVTTWIGYAPLFYAKEKGWLEPLNIKIVSVSSLSENMYLYQAGNADAFAGTQYEYNLLAKKDPSLMPVMMFDRSNGGDVVMGNFSLEQLKNGPESLDVYLEMDSINILLLKDFVRKYALENKTINYINHDQAYISTLEAKKMPAQTLVVTYTPYNIDLERHGFKELASTKGSLDLLVVDALFATEEVFHTHRKQFLALKGLVNDALHALKNDPDEFYMAVKPYMLGMDRDAFEKSLDDIVWINNEISEELRERMEMIDFPIRDLI
jgi:NitT/TauT family transport system substrate-binding protein